eukprot:298199-Alexandrium_andersonii.AAC.1
MARLLALVEAGAPWPSAFLHAKAAFLAKSAEPTTEPLDRRVLMICAAVYRRWAAIRLRHLDPWIRKWACPEMFAGVPSKGAAMASWLFARTVESARGDGLAFSAKAMDIY